ncbi:MAG: phage tail protein [Hyphomicrobiales bacterium]
MNLYNNSMPVGSVVAFAGNIDEMEPAQPFYTNPTWFGWLVCDGRSLRIVKYPHLFVTIGFLYGGDKESGEFNLPDYRGMFLRAIGSDEASTEDRKAAIHGEENGVGSTQDCALQSHKHEYNMPVGATPGEVGSAFASIEQNLTSEPKPASSQEVKISNQETRPRNVFVHYLIKAYLDPYYPTFY